MWFYAKIDGMIPRTVRQQINAYLQGKDHKIFFVWGPRRSGKTTLLKELSKELGVPRFNFDFQSDREFFEPTREALTKITDEHNVILIDEVQNYPGSTVALKLLYDEFNVKIIATGSSELRQKSEKDFDTLAGRYTEHYCLPLSIEEISDYVHVPEYKWLNFRVGLQNELQTYGAYPEVYVNRSLSDPERVELLQTILDAYVLKDVIDIYNLKNEKLAKDILIKIALQIGQEVSIAEIAKSLRANESTVASYIEIFIKNYILIPVHPIRVNMRRAVSDNRKLYFYDMGIRNTLIKDFRELELRPDKGNVFENFVIIELEKQRRNKKIQQGMYFYREYSGKEVDIVLENYKKNYVALEVKSNVKAKSRDVFPLPHTFMVVNPENYFEMIKTAFNSNS